MGYFEKLKIIDIYFSEICFVLVIYISFKLINATGLIQDLPFSSV